MRKEESGPEEEVPLLTETEHTAVNIEESPDFCIQKLIVTRPDKAVRWLISKGCLRLGSFTVTVRSFCGQCTWRGRLGVFAELVPPYATAPGLLLSCCLFGREVIALLLVGNAALCSMIRPHYGRTKVGLVLHCASCWQE